MAKSTNHNCASFSSRQNNRLDCNRHSFELSRKTNTDFDDKILEYLHRPIFLSVLLVGLTVATQELDLHDHVTFYTIKALETIAVLVWLRFGLRLVDIVVDELQRSEKRFKFITPTTNSLIKNTLSIVLVALAVYAIFLVWDIDITAWIASAGIIGIAVGFAAKDTPRKYFWRHRNLCGQAI